MTTSLKVPVIGAGFARLTTARELQRESHQVVVFEKSHRIGGTWAYDPRVQSDLEKVYDDPRTYPGHEEVLIFLEDFARNFELTKLIQFNTAVTRVEVIG
ncbi:flavin-containing monooxygenase FMO GS-OX5-like protein, partial [Tanacetum coccineum]